MDSITFDRTKPLYRLFMLDGDAEWWTVELDNTPGRKLSDAESEAVHRLVFKAPWRQDFLGALAKHSKATVYQTVHPSYEVPAGCNAILRNVRYMGAAKGVIAVGAIYGDREQRWPDGTRITISFIQSGPDENGIIRTRNSVYKVEQ